MNGSTEKNLSTYNARPSALPNIIVFASLFIGIVTVLVWTDAPPFRDWDISFPFSSLASIDRFIFVCYLTAFASMWVVYFLSRSTLSLLRVRTLRLLLNHTSLNWGTAEERLRQRQSSNHLLTTSSEINDEQLGEIEGYFKDKSRTSLQTLGMLIAVATLELGQINLIRHWNSSTSGVDPWEEWTLGLATLAATGAFVMFVVATDSLDSLFNRFRGTMDRHKLIDHFYKKTINLRYFGLVLLLLGAVMIVAFHNPIFGATSLGFVFALGYSTWFPTLDPADLCSPARATICRVAVVIAPFILRTLIAGIQYAIS